MKIRLRDPNITNQEIATKLNLVVKIGCCFFYRGGNPYRVGVRISETVFELDDKTWKSKLGWSHLLATTLTLGEEMR